MKIALGLVPLLLSFTLQARPTPDYLPGDSDPDPAIPPPEQVLGWEVGQWHVSHDKLHQYMQRLAEASPRVSITTTGFTHEQRPLVLLAITSEENQAKLEELREAHLAGNGPLVVWLGYSVHGNEPSGSNASMLTAYHLAASRSDSVREMLQHTVVLIDPSVNPDGLQRYATWANSNAAVNPVADPVTRQHNENWANGRTNHYWFDLNRDWLPLVHPSSRARVQQFHRWLPHVLTDHHEQGGYPGFFFQPGVPTRQNPLTPDANLDLTRALARYHAQVLDEAGQPLFTEDAYDDFYFGKGSTYPDINGSIGILFEQKAIGGQQLETSNGIETFERSVSNQFEVSLSTLKGAWEMRDLLKTYQSGFHRSMQERAADRPYAGWVVGDDDDPARARAFLDILDLHRIEYRPLGQTVRAGGQEFRTGGAWVIPARQRQFGLLEAIMEQRTSFEDNTFYDVSAWTLPLAFNLPFGTVKTLPNTTEVAPTSPLPPADNPVAWAVPWNQLQAAALLQDLLDAGARVRTAIKPFSGHDGNRLVPFEAGTLLIQSGIQDPEALTQVREILRDAALNQVRVHTLDSSITPSGPDLGTGHFRRVKPVRPLIVGGDGASSYGTGEIWHLLDQRLGIAAPLVEAYRLDDVDLSDYSHLLMADGKYGEIRNGIKSRIENWVKDGGILVTISRSALWAESLCFESDATRCNGDSKDHATDPEPGDPPAARRYADHDRDRAELVIGGAIVATVADLSHPMLFGYRRPELPLFRRGTVLLETGENPYSAPVRYTQQPLMAGFIGEDRLQAMHGQPALIVDRTGDGLLVRFANNPLFRGFWRGTERLFVNALYFGQVVDSTELPE